MVANAMEALKVNSGTIKLDEKDRKKRPVDGKPYEDQTLYNWVLATHDSFRKHLNDSKVIADWNKWVAYENTDAWDGRHGVATRMAEFQSNMLFEVTQTLAAAMTTGTPRPEIKPDPRYTKREEMEAAVEYAKGLKRELVRVWEETKMKSKLRQGILEYGIKGTTCYHVPFNPDTQEIEPEPDDIYGFLPDPNLLSPRDVNKKLSYFRCVVMTVDQIFNTYGIKVKSMGSVNNLKQFRETQQTDNTPIKDAEGAVGDTEDDVNGGSLVLEYHTTDYTLEEYEDYKLDKEGQKIKDENDEPEMVTKTRPKFENGRVLTIVKGHKDWIIQDYPCPYIDGPEFVVSGLPQTGKLFGRSEGKAIEPHMKAINQLISNALDNTEYFGNPFMEVIEAFLSDPANAYAPGPGERIPVNKIGGIQLHTPDPIAAFVYNMIGLLKDDADLVQGTTDSFRGLQSSSQSSGEKEKALIVQSGGRVQPKVEDIVTFVEDFYKHCADIVQHLYSDDPILQQVEDDEGGNEQFQPFNPQEGRNMRFNITVKQASMLPVDKQALFEEAVALFQRGGISIEHLIDLAPTLEDKKRAKEYVAKQRQAQEQQGDPEEEARIQEEVQARAEEIMQIEDEDEKMQALEQMWAENPEATFMVLNMLAEAAPEDRAVKAFVQNHAQELQALAEQMQQQQAQPAQ